MLANQIFRTVMNCDLSTSPSQVRPRRYRQPDEKDSDSMTSFVMEGLPMPMREDSQRERRTMHMSRKPPQDPVV